MCAADPEKIYALKWAPLSVVVEEGFNLSPRLHSLSSLPAFRVWAKRVLTGSTSPLTGSTSPRTPSSIASACMASANGGGVIDGARAAFISGTSGSGNADGETATLDIVASTISTPSTGRVAAAESNATTPATLAYTDSAAVSSITMVADANEVVDEDSYPDARGSAGDGSGGDALSRHGFIARACGRVSTIAATTASYIVPMFAFTTTAASRPAPTPPPLRQPLATDSDAGTGQGEKVNHGFSGTRARKIVFVVISNRDMLSREAGVVLEATFPRLHTHFKQLRLRVTRRQVRAFRYCFERQK